MKYLLLLFLPILSYGQLRPDICKACVQDTTGGYISIEDTSIWNPVCNYEVLTAEHVILSEQLKISRIGISFYPHKLNKDYTKFGDDRGHVLSWEDLAYSKVTAIASYNLKRNLALEPHLQNVGTKYASEQLGRSLAKKYGSVQIYGGVTGTVGKTNGINAPMYYWTIINTPQEQLCYYMPTTGPKINRKYLNDPTININLSQLIIYIGFNPLTINF